MIKNILDKTAKEFNKECVDFYGQWFCKETEKRIKQFIRKAQKKTIKETMDVYENEIKKVLKNKGLLK